MAAKNLVRSTFEKRGSGTWKRTDRKSDRRKVSLALRRLELDPEHDADCLTRNPRGCDGRVRNKHVSRRLFGRVLIKHKNKPWDEVTRILYAKLGKTYRGERIRELIRDMESGRDPWGLQNDLEIYIDEDGILRLHAPSRSWEEILEWQNGRTIKWDWMTHEYGWYEHKEDKWGFVDTFLVSVFSNEDRAFWRSMNGSQCSWCRSYDANSPYSF